MTINKTLLAGTIGAALLSASLYQAEPQGKAPLTFEVASIKPNSQDDNRMMMRRAAGGRVDATGFNTRMLIRTAFKLQDFQVIGGPAWLTADRWDIQAKGEENASPAQVDEMLQNLLVDRFQLKYHKETRELPTYALVVGKNGHKLVPATEASLNAPPPSLPSGGRGAGGGTEDVMVTRSASGGAGGRGGGMMMVRGANGQMQMSSGGMTMTQLAQMLSQTLGRTVLDQTGLTGQYDVKLSWTPDIGSGGPLGFSGGFPPGMSVPVPGAPIPPDTASIFTAVQEQLGLKIDSTKGPVEVLVIDKIEKPSTPQY